VIKPVILSFALAIAFTPTLSLGQSIGPHTENGPPPPPSAFSAPDRAAPGAAERMSPPSPFARDTRGTAADPGFADELRRPMAGASGE